MFDIWHTTISRLMCQECGKQKKILNPHYILRMAVRNFPHELNFPRKTFRTCTKRMEQQLTGGFVGRRLLWSDPVGARRRRAKSPPPPRAPGSWLRANMFAFLNPKYKLSRIVSFLSHLRAHLWICGRMWTQLTFSCAASNRMSRYHPTKPNAIWL